MKNVKTLLGILTFTIALLVDVQAQPFLTNGLVAYYPFTGNALDQSGNGNDGTPTNVTFTTDRFQQAGAAAAFSGGSISYIMANDSPSLRLNNLTVCAWINTSNDVSAWQGVIAKNSYPNPAIGWQFGVHSGEMITSVDGSGGHMYWFSPPAIADGNWHFLALTIDRDGGIITCYVDSVVEAPVTPAWLPSSYLSNPGPLLIGTEVSKTASFLGAIDDVRIYNRVLSGSEIQQLYVYKPGPLVNLIKAVKPSFSNLTLTTNYQLQVSPDMKTWTNHGSPFTATNTSMVYPQYWDVDNWNSLYFRLHVAL
jgi:hypothetical protein